MTSYIKSINDLRITNMLDGWKQYDVDFASGDDMINILKELNRKYHTVINRCGRYVGTAEYHGYILCKDLRVK